MEVIQAPTHTPSICFRARFALFLGDEIFMSLALLFTNQPVSITIKIAGQRQTHSLIRRDSRQVFGHRDLQISAGFWLPRFLEISGGFWPSETPRRISAGFWSPRFLEISAGFWPPRFLEISVKFWPPRFRDLGGQNPAKNLEEISEKILYG